MSQDVEGKVLKWMKCTFFYLEIFGGKENSPAPALLENGSSSPYLGISLPKL